MLNTSPFGVGVDFTCEYDTSVEVASTSFNVEDVSIDGTHSSSGTLDSGFTLSVGDGNTIILGDDITFKTTWSLTFADVSPHYESCLLTQGTQTVPLVKDGCMASALGVEKVSASSNEVAIKYKTFIIENETAATQTILCNLKLCSLLLNCAKANTCPADGTDIFYRFE